MTHFQQVTRQAIHGRPSAALRVRPDPPAIHGLRAGPLTFRADAWSVLAHQLQAVPCSETPPVAWHTGPGRRLGAQGVIPTSRPCLSPAGAAFGCTMPPAVAGARPGDQMAS